MMKLLQSIKNVAEKFPERIAFVSGENSITYKKLWDDSYGFSKILNRQGTKPVIVYGHKSIEMIVSFIACLIAKRAYIPVEKGTPENRIHKILQLSQAELIIANEPLKLDDNECLSIQEIAARYKEDCDAVKNENSIAYIIFTSGSTGEPKGVPIFYESLDNFTDWINNVFDNYRNSHAVVLNQASFSFDLSVADMYFALSGGHTLVASNQGFTENYGEIFDIINIYDINIMVMTPTSVKLLLAEPKFCEENYPSLECIYFCGESLEVTSVKKIRKRFKNMEIVNAYGPTEATSAVCAIKISDEMLSEEYLPVGEIKSAAVKIEISDDEIILKGKSVFGGYLGRIQGGYFQENNVNCYRTGDLGFIENGLLYCKGRADSQIKYKGYRIELGEIENNLLKINGVREAVCIAKYNGDKSIVKLIKAFVTLDKPISTEDIKNQLRKNIPFYMIPKIITVMNSIPINKNNKYDRKRLSEL